MLKAIARKYCLTAAIGIGAVCVGFFSGFLVFGSETEQIIVPVETAVETVVEVPIEEAAVYEAPVVEELLVAGADEEIIVNDFVAENIYNPPQLPHYILGIHEGKVAVFTSNEFGTVLDRLTEKPVSALTEDERQRLESGVAVNDEAELLSLLQDYDS